MKLNSDSVGDSKESEIAETSLFLPHIPKEKKDQYNLMYAPSNLFMFVTLFYSLYERIFKSKFLIT